MNPVAKLAVLLAIPILLAAAAAVSVMGYVLYEGPRMRMQPNVRAWQAEVPPMPAGAVPASTPDASPNGKAPSAEAAAGMANPVPASEESIARGKVYYQYYCVFCHGDAGDGNGPVGQSYVPKPADLRSPKVGAYADGQVLRAMLTGVGHEPVLERVVPDEHRWPLVNYVRTLAVLPKK